MIGRILADDIAVARARRAARAQAAAQFAWAHVLSDYGRELAMLGGYAPAGDVAVQPEIAVDAARQL